MSNSSTTGALGVLFGSVILARSNLTVQLRNVVFIGALLSLHKIYVREGKAGVLRVITQTLRLIPGVNGLLGKILDGEIKGAMKSLVDGDNAGKEKTVGRVVPIPEKGVSREDILAELEKDQKEDGEYCHEGKAFALVYFNESGKFDGQGDFNAKVFDKYMDNVLPEKLGEEQRELAVKSFKRFHHSNALNPLMFPALRKYETEAISMAANLMNGDAEVVGAMTSGGTESILMAIKAFREMAREKRPHITEPELVAPITIHPAHEKAGYYFGVKIVHCSVDEKTKRANVKELESLINENTIGIAVSAPQYCHCVVDPIEEVAAVARKKGLPLHVDACYGGFILPWIEKLGYSVPKFDFRVPGVTTMSLDAHKYGYVSKGASFLLFRNESVRKYMYYAYSNWPGGLYISPSMAGTRPGANIAMAWATLKFMGQDGYIKEADAIMKTTKVMKDSVQAIPELSLVAESDMTGFAIQSNDSKIHIFAVADEMEELGWKMERQSNPDSLHCSILPAHANKNVGETFGRNLAQSVSAVKSKGSNTSEGSAAIYGMVGSIPDKTIVDDFLKGLFSEIYKTK